MKHMHHDLVRDATSLHGIDPATVRPHLTSPLIHLALERQASVQCNDMLAWLGERGIKPDSLEAVNAEGNTSTHEAAASGHLGALQWLIMHGASLATRNLKNMGVVHYASRNGDIEMLQWLSTQDEAIVHHVDVEGNTAMHYAARGGHVETLQWLLAHDAVPYVCNTAGQSLVHVATMAQHTSSLVWSWRAGLDFNTQDHHGDTPAHYAARKGDIATMLWLVDHGCNMFAINLSGVSAFDIASQNCLAHASILHAYLRASHDSNQLWDDGDDGHDHDTTLAVTLLSDDEEEVTLPRHESIKLRQERLVQALVMRNITEHTYALQFLELQFPETVATLANDLGLAATELASALATTAKMQLHHHHHPHHGKQRSVKARSQHDNQADK
ncbi:Aste57867_9428 [Aphanomyces stellatus]|uniref:Aste57867_9428 protein n=1 Tax=Aphanomyces stellatus TaxID=120398 RepID=A0A485KNA5_9STRA|nr:hypothetical protein As57867_009392 [Aphanomyces stellatus]VFT86308.1 Aste57867_9428 [Aphanomyces stellatus]